MTTEGAACWCGQRDLEPFSPSYARCSVCHTLVSLKMPTILARARADLPEHGLYWLRTLLRFRLPPARLMAIGSGHGGFAALLRWAGFDATGLDISPGVVNVAREAFDVPGLLGPVDDERIEPGSLDVVALMDVLEHLRDPVEILRRCLELLKADGILLIQTPCFDDSRAYHDLAGRTGRFPEVLPPREHYYLFGRRSIGTLLGRLGAGHVAFEPPLFADYDMVLVASRVPLRTSSGEDIDMALSRSPSGRMVQALVGLGRELDDVKGRHAVSEADRAARLATICTQGQRLAKVEAERDQLAAEVAALGQCLATLEADRATHLGIIQEQERHLSTLASERENLGAERDDLRAESVAQERQLQVVLAHLRALQHLVSAIQARRGYRLLRRLGFWKWFEEAVGQAILGPDQPARPTDRSPSSTRRGDAHDHDHRCQGVRSARRADPRAAATGKSIGS